MTCFFFIIQEKIFTLLIIILSFLDSHNPSVTIFFQEEYHLGLRSRIVSSSFLVREHSIYIMDLKLLSVKEKYINKNKREKKNNDFGFVYEILL